MATGLSACQKKSSDKDEQGRTILIVSGYPSIEGKDKDNFDKRIKRFEEEKPDVVIKTDEWVFDLKTFYSKAAGKQLPTVFETYFTEVSQCVESGYVADLTAALKKYGYEGRFNPYIEDMMSKDGKMYAFPYSAGLMGLAYNTDMFRKAGLMEKDGTPKQPKDWDEVVEFAVKIKEATGKPGIIFPTTKNNGGWIFSCLAWSYGVNFMEQDEDGKWKATFNTPETAEALQYIKDLKWKYDVLPAHNLIDYAEYYKIFATGGAGMMISNDMIASNVVQYEMEPNHVGMMGIPRGPKSHVSLIAGNTYMVSATATEDQIDAAIRWLKMSNDFNATENFKTDKEKSIVRKVEKNQVVGIKGMSPWSDNTESVMFERKLIDQYANINPNHVRLYNEFVVKGEVEFRTEEPVCAQELYATLDNCVQEVLVNEKADCAAILEKANADFQKNYLNNL